MMVDIDPCTAGILALLSGYVSGYVVVTWMNRR